MTRNNTLDAKAVGKRIRQTRLELGFSQRDLAIKGVSYAYISRLETGARAPSWSALVLLSDHFRKTATELVRGLEAEGHTADRKWIVALQKITAEVTALYLLTGSTDVICPLCERLP